MKKTPEEIINQQTWEILQRIKEELLTTTKGDRISYKRPNIVGAGIIPWDRKVRILRKLQEQGALKIIKQRSKSESFGLEFNWESVTKLELKIIQPKFDKIYKRYQKACDSTTYLDEYQKNYTRSPKDKKDEVDFLKIRTNKSPDDDYKLNLLDDKSLGLLMEIAFSKRPKPQDKSLEYFALHLRKEEQYGVTTFSDLQSLYIDGYKSSDFYTLKTSQGLTAARKLSEMAKEIKDEIESVRKQVSQQATRPTTSLSQLDINRILAPKVKRLQQINSLSKSFKEKYSKGERITNKDLVRLLVFPEIINELHDEVSATKQQVDNIRKFLKAYIEQYSERKLVGQGEIESTWFLAERWMNALNSDEYIRKYNMENVPLRVGTNAEYFCHSMLYLDYIEKIKLRSITLRPATEKTADGKTMWTRLNGSNKYVMQWCSTVDNLDTEIGPDQSIKSNLFFAEYIKNKKSKDISVPSTEITRDMLVWHGLSLEVDTGRGYYQRTDMHHKFQTSKPQFKVLEALLLGNGKEVIYKMFYTILKNELRENKLTNHKDKRKFVSKKVREIRTYFGINTKKNREDDIFESTGKGYKLIAPMNL